MCSGSEWVLFGEVLPKNFRGGFWVENWVVLGGKILLGFAVGVGFRSSRRCFDVSINLGGSYLTCLFEFVSAGFLHRALCGGVVGSSLVSLHIKFESFLVF